MPISLVQTITVLAAVVLFSAQQASGQVISIATKVMLPDSLLTIASAARLDTILVIANANGTIEYRSVSTGMIVQKFELENNAQIVDLDVDTVNGAVYAQVADGTVYMKKEADAEFVRIAVDGVVNMCASADTLWCLGNSSIFAVVRGEQQHTGYKLPEVFGAADRILKIQNSRFAISTTTGKVYRMSLEADTLAVEQSFQSDIGRIQGLFYLDDRIITTSAEGSYVLDYNFQASLLTIPDFAQRYVNPETVRFRVFGAGRFKDSIWLVVRSKSQYEQPITRVCVGKALDKKFYIRNLAIDSTQYEYLTSVVPFKDDVHFSGVQGIQGAYTGTSWGWFAYREPIGAYPWEAYTATANGIFAVRRSGSFIDLGTVTDSGMHNVVIRTIPVVSTGSIFSVMEKNGEIFVGMTKVLCRITKHGEVYSYRIPKPNDSFKKFYVDTTRELIWGFSTRDVHVWSFNGDSIISQQYSPTGLLGSIAEYRDGSLLLSTFTGLILHARLTNDSVELTQLQSRLTYVELVGTVSDTTYGIAGPSGNLTLIYKFPWTAPTATDSISLSSKTVPALLFNPIVDGNIVVLSDTMIYQITPSTGLVTDQPYVTPGTIGGGTNTIIGHWNSNITTLLRGDRIGLFPDHVTSVQQEHIPHVYIQSIYPNPATTHLKCQLGRLLSADRNTVSVHIIDQLGRILKDLSSAVNWRSDEFTFSISADVTDLECGVYFLAVKNRGYSECKQFTITR
ncbi:MAG: hypothetical protein IAE64_04080 [Flavobacteriales bacterium]|nr:MAG: hypothetical protein F9K28_08845 [Bacteroidota bacterium]MBE2265411.1 hypothetical protein [Flavobacteriales bacterium]MBV6464346.1 hypothetical protein [Chlorobiota bacterium]MBZ0194517.1 T9SS type A sorting domain-containing protein [Candidatus Kapabacteria bacterium]MCL4277789.1 hypothetical protein [Ignavibacteria bacterium]